MERNSFEEKEVGKGKLQANAIRLVDKKKVFHRGCVSKIPRIPMGTVTMDCKQMQITQFVEFYSTNLKILLIAAMPSNRCPRSFCSREGFASVNRGRH